MKEKKSEILTLKIQPSLKRRLEKESQKSEDSMSQIMIKALKKYLKIN